MGLGTEEYFNAVYNDTVRNISRFIVSRCSHFQDAEDILQNVFTRFYQRIIQKGFADIESPEAFLINIAKFECKTYHKKTIKSRENEALDADYSEEETVYIEEELSKHQPVLEDVICDDILAKQIFEDIASSDSDIGKIFYLHFTCDMKLEEVANTLGLKLSTVKTKLYRTIARQKDKFNI